MRTVRDVSVRVGVVMTTLALLCGAAHADEAALASVTHKPGSGVKLSTQTGGWLSIRPRVMMLYQRDMPEDGPATHALTIRRARVVIKSGYTPLHLSSKLELAFSARDLRVSGGNPRQTPVLTWSVAWERLRDVRIKVGQFKIGYSRQRLISSGDLQLVDRSAVQGEFTLDRDIGVELYSEDLGGLDKIRYVLGVYNGEGRDVYQLSDSPPMMLGRLELMPFGRFDAYKEADLKRHRSPKVAVAVAGAWMSRALRDRGVLGSIPADGGTTDHLMMTADLLAKWRGLSLVVEGHKRASTRHPGSDAPEVLGRSGWGVFSTIGWLLPMAQDVELSARTGGIFAANKSSLKDLRETGVGVSWYLSGHANKLQMDVTRLTSDTATDLRFRLQLQVSM